MTQGLCAVCQKFTEVYPTIYASTGRTVKRCSEHLNQPEDYRVKLQEE